MVRVDFIKRIMTISMSYSLVWTLRWSSLLSRRDRSIQARVRSAIQHQGRAVNSFADGARVIISRRQSPWYHVRCGPNFQTRSEDWAWAMGSGAAGAAIGAGTYGMIGVVGVADAGTAVGITLGPFIAIAATVGLAGYDIYWLRKPPRAEQTL